MFKLVIEDDEGNKTVVPMIRDEITIGRQDGNTIRLTERNVSRKHARLVKDDGAVFLEEVSARYGTRKNGERIDGRTEFSIGDVFTIGDYRLTLQSEVAPKAKTPKRPNGASPPKKNGFSNQPTQITSMDEPSSDAREGTEILATDPAKLVIVSSNFAGQEFPLARKEMVIGRGEECDIIIDHRSVSQKHAKIVREQGGEYKIIDLKSKNGVKVGGEEYRAVHLKRGDIVELGHVKFRFVEPGENYVFTPQAAEDDFVPSSNTKPVLALVGLLALVAVAVGGYIAMSSQPEVEPVTKTETRPEPEAVTPDEPPPEEIEEDTSAAEMVEKAKAKYLAGKVTEAVVILEMAKEKDLAPDLSDEVDDLHSKARFDKPFERYFHNGRDYFEKERWVEALREFQQIAPSDRSNIYKLMEEENYKERAIENIFEDAIAIANEGENDEDFDAARRGPQAVLEMIPDHDQAATVLEQIEEKRKAKVRRAVAVRPQKTPPPSKDSKPDEPSEPTKPAKDPSLIDPLHKEAFSHNMKGRHSEAIEAATEAVYHGCGNRCFRVLAIAYKNKGDTANACRYHKRAGIEIPDDLDCQ